MQNRSPLLVLNISERIRFYYMATIDLVTVLEAVLTSRQTSEKLQCLYENLPCRMITVKRLFCNDRAFFSCNDRTLIARCPRHIQSVFNLIVANHPYGHPCLMVN